MKKRTMLIVASALLCFSSAFAKEIPYGIVNFATCVQESKQGKVEQESFEKLREQMTSLITDIEKQMQGISEKFNDAEFVDSLSPEAEQELKARFQTLGEERNQYQNQYMQILQQANMQLMQTMNNHVNLASTTVRKNRKIPIVVREEACFSYEPEFDITKQVIEEMDKSFEKQAKATPPAKQTSP